MILTFGDDRAHKRHKILLATIEHLDQKGSADRGKHIGHERTVLACLECNTERGRTKEGVDEFKDRKKMAAVGVGADVVSGKCAVHGG